MGNINIRVDNKDELKIKLESRVEGKTISEYCRQKILDETQQLDGVTIENRIESLERLIRSLVEEAIFNKRFMYYFLVLAANEDKANKAYAAAEKELERSDR
jgi:hypothetical protein